MNNKLRLLDYLATHGQVENPKEIVHTMQGVDIHALVHLIWSCQKLGLLTFRQRGANAKRSMPSKITITQKGREFLDRTILD